MTDTVSAEDVLGDETVVHELDDDIVVVGIEDVDVDLATSDCTHVIRAEDGSRLYALERHPASGYWTCCPNCGMLLGQRNLGSVPAEFR